MEYRRINIKCKQSDLDFIIKNLITKAETEKGEDDPIIEYSVEILDSSDNYKALGVLEEVIDWNFEEESVEETLGDASDTSEIREVIEVKSHPIYSGDNKVPSLNECVVEIVATWKLYSEFPKIIPLTAAWVDKFSRLINSNDKSSLLLIRSVTLESLQKINEIYNLEYFYYNFEELLNQVRSVNKLLNLKEFIEEIYEILKR